MSTVRDAVAVQEAQPARVSPAQAIKEQVAVYGPVIERALPRHMTAERFSSTILTACRSTPDLLKCDPATVIAAAIKAAQLGLEPNDERGLCYLIPRGGKATFQLGYKGMIELGRRSGEVKRVVARTVHANDEFDYRYGTTGEGITHKPARQDPGDSIFWYAIAWAPDGSLMDFVVLTRSDVEYHRSFSAQPSGQMWTKSFDAAARKTAVRELFKLLPQSPEMAGAIGVDDRVLHVNTIEADVEPDPEDVGEAVIVDEETGEVLSLR